jgi:tetratricopeptide (TPR) repeat protein
MYRRELKVVYNWLGNFSGNPLFLNLGDRASALDYYRRGLVIAEEMSAADPKSGYARLDLAVSLGKIGDILLDSQPVSSAEHYRRGLVVTRSLLDITPGEFRYQRRHVMCLNGLAGAMRSLGDRKVALQQLRQSLEMLQEMSKRHPTNVEVQASKHAALLELAELSLDTGDFTAALEHNRQALAIAEASSNSISTDLYARWRLADTYKSFGKYHIAVASNLMHPAIQRLDSWRDARVWSKKSLDLWDDWSRHAVSSIFNTTRREEAERALEQCDEAVARLASGSQ